MKSLKKELFLAGFVPIDLLLETILGKSSRTLRLIVGIVFLLSTFFWGRKNLSQNQTAGIIFAILAIVAAYSTFLCRTNLYYTFWFNTLFGLLLISILSCIFVLTIIGFAVIIMTYIGVNYLPFYQNTLHAYQ
ncbi:MAG: hypothetical protein J7L62_04765 [Candidatus Aminicenantes bacterium]|nr:hypothetical protein [Candidatus Aminicenantes bacterium]